MTTRPTIVTSPTHNPTPNRHCDYCAHYDGEEEAGCYGFGSSPEKAIEDFVENYQEWHDERLGLSFEAKVTE